MSRGWGLMIAGFVMLTTGCASNYVRVTEYDGNGAGWIPGVSAVIGGCVVNYEGEMPGRILYEGDNCVYDSGAE